MYGRYGNDKLGGFLLIAVIVLIVVQAILSVAIPEGTAGAVISLSMSLIIVLLYVWIIFRFMSRNIVKRRRENEIYLKTSRRLKRFFTFNTSTKTKSRNRDDDFYIFRDCTVCGATLRLPRKRGKHSVKCPKCSHNFYVKSK